ncbi:MAG: hypothetical protein JNM63_01395, partial [Spirochaetia bacterium]|nr:hypothetical protein [Spirochaetia bacterium]
MKIFFFVFAIPSLFSQELPGIFFEQKPESFSFSAEGDYKLNFFLDPAREPVDLAIGVIPDREKSSGALPVLVSINGSLYGKYNTSPKEFKTLRIPRLFLKPGANLLVIEINKGAFKEGKTSSQ